MQADIRNRKIALSAVFAVIAAICGILEGMLSLSFIIPLPGVRLGIVNIFIMFSAVILGVKYAFLTSFARMLLVFAFTGNVFSLAMSFFGGILSLSVICFMLKTYDKIFSFIGISAVSALFHGIGQMLCAFILIGDAVIYYMPIMLICCTATGIFTGTLMNISYSSVKNIASKLKIKE